MFDIFKGFTVGSIIIASVIYVSLLKEDASLEKESGVFIVSSNLRGIGTAFKVGSDKFVTARHVCEALYDLGSVTIKNKLGSFLVKEVHAYPNLSVDVCVLKTVKQVNGYTFTLSDRQVSKFEVLTSIGYPSAETPIRIMDVTVLVSEMMSEAFYFGNIAMASEYFILTTGKIIPGMSGGCVIDSNGEVVGVNARVNTSGEGSSYFSPIYRVREWIYGI